MAHNFSLAVPYAGVAGAANAVLEFKTPATGTIKLKAAGHSTGASLKVELVEAPTLTTGSTAVVPVNIDRASSVNSAVVAKSNPTTISAGTVVDTAFSYEVDPTEYTLKVNTVYMIKVTNTEGTAKDITIIANYSEDAVVTNASGIAVVPGNSAGTDVAYTATKSGWTIASGTVDIVDEDISAELSAVKTVHTVTFTAKIGETVKNYCRIDFRGYTQRTNASGELVVTNVPDGTYPWTAMYNGGYYNTGTVTVNGDETVEVALTIPQV